MAIVSPTEQFDTMRGKEARSDVSAWLGDAIYGINDGLGAIFGMIAGVAGYTANGHTILMSGLFGALASTLSMGAGAWLATKSENELMERAYVRARDTVRAHRGQALRRLSTRYEAKGFDARDARHIAEVIGRDDERFVQTLIQETEGHPASVKGNPWSSAMSGSISTFVGAIVPLLPFFFLTGTAALIVAAIVSIMAHFAVGASKSLVTVRSWWASGFEMMMAGVIVGVVSYLLGLLANAFFS
ncbi:MULTISPECIES: VIT1/CCC1 transporter family protein [Alicyclobacillus]|uniref:VIT1/CCC1 transporter family protein n=1 Tax=Alicyclobacillus acidoterrestris (strain ATCC 49025 / DSM 3922 / CIP 106132 / NCIMB 13137 / GD3B) TaxID=1356854 RepID=T0CIR8_ALIAG|nr:MULTISPECIES: VIT1/CCC1 transporter family protein [Alicyclobacillus]EPZ52699.1 hypothetical protein N007_02615 [Alicyclobacillus acidoterrestris ATCC 49025]UNO48901.1 VIT1/CCC1 transporter family protein [Alicyclobacillus acidoterrestris]